MKFAFRFYHGGQSGPLLDVDAEDYQDAKAYAARHVALRRQGLDPNKTYDVVAWIERAGAGGVPRAEMRRFTLGFRPGPGGVTSVVFGKDESVAEEEITMIGRFTLPQLRRMRTLHVGQYDDLKYDNGSYRVWLSRARVEDGAPYNDQVTVERLVKGRWTTLDKYDPRSVGAGVHEATAAPWVSLTYGTLPSLRDFEFHLRDAKDEEGARLIGDPPRVYWFTLVDDAEIGAARAIADQLHVEAGSGFKGDITYGPDRYYPHKTAFEVRSVKALHKLVEGLTELWNQGDEKAGDLASSIMYTLRYEWV